MIVHFLEVWLLIAVTFVVGCGIGAWAYGMLADSPLALAQGAVADVIGDGLDRLKAAIGLGPEWRAVHLKATTRPLPATPQFAAPQGADSRRDDEMEQVAAALPDLSHPRRALAPPVRPETRPDADEPRGEAEDQNGETVFSGGDPLRIVSAEAVADDGIVPRRPPGLPAPRSGIQDNLTRIRGIGERNEAVLNRLGIFHFGQIASWTPAEVRWIGQYLAFPERVEHDDWVGQAAILAAGGDTGFEKAADRRRRRRREKFESQDDEGDFDEG
jgi:predicted flap endonuclease-1-like 5' DNA nuclease